MAKSVLTDGRAVYVTGSIDAEMTVARREIHQLALEEPAAPITLVINSNGGEVVGAFAILDAMERARCESRVLFHGVVQGLAASAALTILQGCDERRAGPSSLVMAHGSRGGVTGDLLHRQAYDRFVELVHDRMARLYARRSTWHSGEWMRLFESDVPVWLSSAGALELGLIDEVLGSG